MPELIEPATRRLRLRQWRPEDRAPFATLNADPEVMRYFPAPLSREQSDAMVDRLSADLADRGWGLWAVEVREDEKFIGFVGLNPPTFQAAFTPCVEVGWRLARSAWQHGYASEAARAALAVAFTDLGLDEVVSFTAVENVPSERVMQRLGMRHDVAGDFDHPRIPPGRPLRRHLLYRLSRSEWLASDAAAVSSA